MYVIYTYISMTTGVAVGRPGDGQHAVGGFRHGRFP